MAYFTKEQLSEKKAVKALKYIAKVLGQKGIDDAEALLFASSFPTSGGGALITSTELIYVEAKLFARTERVSIGSITGVTFGGGPFSPKTVVSVGGSRNIEMSIICNQNELNSFYSYLQNKIQSFHMANSPSSAVSNADELMKYKQLLDAGAITPEEYEAKKKQLLGL